MISNKKAGAAWQLRPLAVQSVFNRRLLLEQFHRVAESLEYPPQKRDPDKPPGEHELKSRGAVLF
jgi:hypothetical protein